MRGSDGLDNGRIWDLDPDPEDPYIEDEIDQGCETCYNYPECEENSYDGCIYYDFYIHK